MAVIKGNTVKVEYEGRFLDGEVFDSTDKHGGEPLDFVAGEGMVVKGFDDAVIGMNIGEEKEVTIKPSEGYGEKNEESVQRIPKRMIPGKIEIGMELGIPLTNGETIPAVVTKITGDLVTIDLNHPLAGKTLVFKIKLVGIE